MLNAEPADARYLSNHRGHLTFLRSEAHDVCTAHPAMLEEWAEVFEGV